MQSENGTPKSVVSQSYQKSVALTAVLGTTPAIDISGSNRGSILVPGGSAITSLTFYAAESEAGTYLPIQDGSGAIAAVVAASKGYSIQQEVFDHAFIKIVANAEGSVYIALKG